MFEINLKKEGIIFFLLIALSFSVRAADIDVQAGNAYYAELEGRMNSLHWSGLKVVNNGITLDDSTEPFTSIDSSYPFMMQVSFPGYNLKDEMHYYAAMLPDEFDLTKVQNVTAGDLSSEGIFDSTQFPTFYPDYYSSNDNPQVTFCCDTASVEIGEQNFTAFNIELGGGTDYYLLKYDNSGTSTPLFLHKLEDATCYNNTECVSQFMLPVSPQNFNFYVLNKGKIYEYTTYIDGIETTSFPQTALPYNLTIDVVEGYTGNVAQNLDIVVGEEDGQNIFIPYRLSGYVSEAYSRSTTDSSGRESFLVAPTVYPSRSTYKIFIGVPWRGMISNQEELTVTAKDEIVKQSKPLSPSNLFDNAKVTVNAMNQITSYLYKWASDRQEAYMFDVTYQLQTNTWSITDYVGGTGDLYLKTGAPNVIDVEVRNGIMSASGYTVRMKEQDGYLVMNPYTGSAPLDPKTRYQQHQIPAGSTFIVTPTSLGSRSSTVTLEIIDDSGNVVDDYTADIDDSLDIGSGGISYSNDLLKTVVNAINVVLNSQFYSLNY